MMKTNVWHSFSRCFILLVLISAVLLTGCRKKTVQVGPPSADQLQREKEFLSSPGVIVCELQKVKLDNVKLPQNKPYFIRSMERQNKDMLLQGEITIEERQFSILLPMEGNREMALYEKKTERSPYWWGADEVNSMHKINGKYYEFSTLENKTKFSTRPYTGQTGVFKVGKGARQLEKAEFKGSVKSKNTSVAVGEVTGSWPEATGECTIPVGDYTPSIMTVVYDNISISISHNYHRDVNGKQMHERELVYGFKIRKETPYVLDFSNKPVVIFDEPEPDKNRFEAGEEITFAAVLVDPELDIMIRDLTDTAVEVEKEYTRSDGSKYTRKRKKSLDPTVVISRADGQVVAEGIMPFG